MESGESEKNLERIDLPIAGMSCASCAARIEKGLASVEGVSEAAVNFAAEKATVFFDPDRTDLPHLIDKVKDLGYEARVEKTLLPIRGMSCASYVNKVEKALRSIKGVNQIGVNFATERRFIWEIGLRTTHFRSGIPPWSGLIEWPKGSGPRCSVRSKAEILPIRSNAGLDPA